MRFRGRSIAIGFGVVVVLVACAEVVSRCVVPEVMLARFYAQEGDGETAEDQLVCPLVLAGPNACPKIVQAVGDDRLPLRRYAVASLGSLRCETALPSLEKIVANAEEQDYVRADALEALWLVDRARATVAASRHAERADSLGSTARRLLGGAEPHGMSRLDALFCAHE